MQKGYRTSRNFTLTDSDLILVKTCRSPYTRPDQTRALWPATISPRPRGAGSTNPDALLTPCHVFFVKHTLYLLSPPRIPTYIHPANRNPPYLGLVSTVPHIVMTTWCLLSIVRHCIDVDPLSVTFTFSVSASLEWTVRIPLRIDVDCKPPFYCPLCVLCFSFLRANRTPWSFY